MPTDNLNKADTIAFMSLRHEALRVTLYSIFFNLLMSFGKVVVGYFGSSRALIADGIHSLMDLSSDVAVVFGLHLSRLPKDTDHPYGHHRFVTMIQLAIALSIFLFAVGISLSSIPPANFSGMIPAPGRPSIDFPIKNTSCVIRSRWRK